MSSSNAAYLATANDELHIAPEFAVKLDVGTVASKQFSDIGKSVDRLLEIFTYFAKSDSTLNEQVRTYIKLLGYDVATYDAVPYYENPFFNLNWEMHVLAVNNTLTDLIFALKQT